MDYIADLSVQREQILSKIHDKKDITEKEYDRLNEIFENDYFNKQRYIQQSVLFSIPGCVFDIVVLGSETSSKDTFLEIIKSDYHYVKYSMSNDSMYYRFDFFQEEPKECFYKMSLKFYTALSFDSIERSLNDYINMSLLIMSIDPRSDTAVQEIHQLHDKITVFFKKKYKKERKDECEGDCEDEEDKIVEAPPIPVYIVINHCDSQK